MAIRIVRNEAGNCINFYGASNPTYWNACLSGEVDAADNNTVNVINDIITAQTGVTEYEFYRIPYTEFTDSEGNGFATAQDTADYITEKANVIGLGGGGTDLTDEVVCFKLDDTSTSIMLDNGYSYGVNTIKAVNNGDGLITLQSQLGDIVHFTKLDPYNVCDGDGNAIPGGLNDVINYLNELFTVGPFESVVVADPYSTMIADVDGEDTSVSYVGYGLDPVGNDIYGSSNSNSQNGLLTTETINQAGEYFTFDIRVEGTIGFGLVHTQDSYDNGLYSGNVNYANPARFGIDNSAHYGFQFSHWFHPTPNGSWTNYGADTSYSMRSGWSNFNGTDEQNDWLNSNPIKVRVGIDENGFISIDTLRDGVTWTPHVRTSYPVPQGAEYRLGIKTNNTGARVFSLPKVHLLEEQAPTMYFRYIESPDGVFHYPLFATSEEAEYYDEIHNQLNQGDGQSHTHTYADDPTNTTWYMPEASHDPSSYTFSSAPSTTTFNGVSVNYTEITSLTNADLTPTPFSASDITQEEGTNVNIQVTPAGAVWSSSVTITPSGSGLVYDGYSLIQGTLADVGSDTTYTIEVTRANSYGSSVGSMTVTATDVAPVQTNETPWNKALDFSGSSEYATQVHSGNSYSPMKQTHTSQATSGVFGNTSTSSTARPWMCATVFKIDAHNSNQHIWNMGEGASGSDDNIYLRLDANQNLYFGWGRSGELNECRIATSISSMFWYGISIAYSGHRYGTGGSTSGNLYQMFDIRLMSSHNGTWDSITDVGTYNDWNSSASTTGGRMDRQIVGSLTIGGRGSNRSFHGKVASFVVTTLKQGQSMPTDAEHELMITDPKKWMNDYKVGQTYRRPTYSTNSNNWQIANTANYHEPANTTQVWLMGDGTNDSYSNMIRNQVNPW